MGNGTEAEMLVNCSLHMYISGYPTLHKTTSDSQSSPGKVFPSVFFSVPRNSFTVLEYILDNHYKPWLQL